MSVTIMPFSFSDLMSTDRPSHARIIMTVLRKTPSPRTGRILTLSRMNQRMSHGIALHTVKGS